MLLNLILTDAPTSYVYYAGCVVMIIVPIILTLLVARFRGLIASLFCLPFLHGLIVFALNYSQVTDAISKLGDFGTGLLAGANSSIKMFNGFHYSIVNCLSKLITNETAVKIFNEAWFAFVPYLVIFIILFAIFKKRKKRKEEDYF